MNTRVKILDGWPGRESCATVVLVAGYFDPLLSAHAERLQTLKNQHPGKLAVALAEPSEPLLDTRARTELVAALRVVDFVMPYTKELETAFPWAAIYNDTALHGQWRADFKEHVLRRSL